MKFKHFFRTAAAAACIVALAQAQGNYWKLTVLPFPVGGDPMAIYCPISFDGGFVTGNLYEPTQEGWDVNQVFLYRVGDPAPTTIANNSGAIGVSADGTVLGGLVDRGTDVPKNMWGWTYVVGGTVSPLPNYTSYWQKYQQAVAISAMQTSFLLTAGRILVAHRIKLAEFSIALLAHSFPFPVRLRALAL